jgi:hypothetical protein
MPTGWTREVRILLEFDCATNITDVAQAQEAVALSLGSSRYVGGCNPGSKEASGRVEAARSLLDRSSSSKSEDMRVDQDHHLAPTRTCAITTFWLRLSAANLT